VRLIICGMLLSFLSVNSNAEKISPPNFISTCMAIGLKKLVKAEFYSRISLFTSSAFIRSKGSLPTIDSR
jgi:hypothetical protein